MDRFQEIEERLEVIENTLKELLELARLNWQSDSEITAPPVAKGAESFRKLMKTAVAGRQVCGRTGFS